MDNENSPKLTSESLNTLELRNGAGRIAVIDFGGDSVTYSGDLTVAESAKLFFKAVLVPYSTRIAELEAALVRAKKGE